MAVAPIPTLIDKQDNFEIVRDMIALILATETANQQALATAAAKDPELWKFGVFLERSDPIGKWLNVEDGNIPDLSPVVNVWFENADIPGSTGDTVQRQKFSGIFNIDCYGVAINKETVTGHDPADSAASKECQRVVRLVRNILMAAQYAYLLDFPRGQQSNFIWSRWIQSLSFFQPRLEQRPVQNVVGGRIAFRVEFNEFSPQVPGEDLCEVGVDINLNDDGSVKVEADYDYT